MIYTERSESHVTNPGGNRVLYFCRFVTYTSCIYMVFIPFLRIFLSERFVRQLLSFEEHRRYAYLNGTFYLYFFGVHTSHVVRHRTLHEMTKTKYCYSIALSWNENKKIDNFYLFFFFIGKLRGCYFIYFNIIKQKIIIPRITRYAFV